MIWFSIKYKGQININMQYQMLTHTASCFGRRQRISWLLLMTTDYTMTLSATLRTSLASTHTEGNESVCAKSCITKRVLSQGLTKVVSLKTSVLSRGEWTKEKDTFTVTHPSTRRRRSIRSPLSWNTPCCHADDTSQQNLSLSVSLCLKRLSLAHSLQTQGAAWFSLSSWVSFERLQPSLPFAFHVILPVPFLPHKAIVLA